MSHQTRIRKQVERRYGKALERTEPIAVPIFMCEKCGCQLMIQHVMFTADVDLIYRCGCFDVAGANRTSRMLYDQAERRWIPEGEKR